VEGEPGTFLRGTQETGADGVAAFRTVFPGWYPGRTPHVHFKVFPQGGRVLTAQLYFPDEVSDHVYADNFAYARSGRPRDRRNATDRIARAAGPGAVASVEEGAGVMTAALVVGIARG
jgi:protocatechuate 3,4-dioxygenase beta subunit